MSETIPEARELAESIMSATESCGCDECLEKATKLATFALLAREERAAKEEREACAKVALEYPHKHGHRTPSVDAKIRLGQETAGREIASAIRDRSKT